MNDRTKFSRLLLGSNILNAIVPAQCPLLIVPEHQVSVPINRIGVALDFRQTAGERLKLLTALAVKFEASLFVIHVVQDQQDSQIEDPLSQNIDLTLAAIGYPITHYNRVKGENATVSIQRFARKHRLDILALVPKKRTLIKDIFGSDTVKDAVLFNSFPVLIL